VSLRPGSLAFNPDTPRRLSTPLLTPFNSTPISSLVWTLDPKSAGDAAVDEALPLSELRRAMVRPWRASRVEHRLFLFSRSPSASASVTPTPPSRRVGFKIEPS